MKKSLLYVMILLFVQLAQAQHVGIVRKNYFSSYFDSLLQVNVEVLDSCTIRLGSVNPTTGVVTNLGNSEYSLGINLNGATIDPYLNRYYIGSGFHLLSFDINSGELIQDVPISGTLPSSSFQNLRFNPSDSTIYGMLPVNYYSSYYDSIAMDTIVQLDSTHIRFGSLHPETGQYSLIGNSSYQNIYTLAGNSIDPYQMLYYYSAVDTLIGIDLYTGAPYSIVPIQLPPHGIFENISYSCADTSIYGLTRQNYVSSVFDSLFMTYIEVVDSTTFRLSKINPATGVVTLISPYNIGAGGNLTGGAFIDPNSMTYFFSNGNQIVGVSLSTGLITSSATKTFSEGAFALDMMRSTQNCFGASRVRNHSNQTNSVIDQVTSAGDLHPNPADNRIFIKTETSLNKVEIIDSKGVLLFETKERYIDLSSLPPGMYMAKMVSVDGRWITRKFIRN